VTFSGSGWLVGQEGHLPTLCRNRRGRGGARCACVCVSGLFQTAKGFPRVHPPAPPLSTRRNEGAGQGKRWALRFSHQSISCHVDDRSEQGRGESLHSTHSTTTTSAMDVMLQIQFVRRNKIGHGKVALSDAEAISATRCVCVCVCVQKSPNDSFSRVQIIRAG
jgi:hypothetical protein